MPAPTPAPRPTWQLISAHLRKKDFAKALAAIDKLEAKQPDKPLAANLRGRVLLAQKDNAGARKSFERALSIDPNYFAAAASLAALDLADKKPEDAKKRFEALLAKNPKNGQALLALARLAANQGAPKDELAALLGKAIDANPTDAAPRLLLIDLYLRNKDNKQALAAAQSAVVAVPNSPELLAALGRVQQVSGDVNQAIATYGKLVALQPLSPRPHVRLAEAHVANKDNQGRRAEPAQGTGDQARLPGCAARADHPGCRGQDVSGCNQDGAHGAGATAQDGPGADARRRCQCRAARTGRPRPSAYKAALQLAPATELATKLHAATVESGKAKEAEQFAATWMTAHPKDAQFPAYLADMALGRKDYAAAEKLYLGVLQIQPDSAVALNNLAWVTLQLQKDGAVGLRREGQPAGTQAAAVHGHAGDGAFGDKGEHARAIELQTQAVALQPANNALKLNLARSTSPPATRPAPERSSSAGQTGRSIPQTA